MDATGLEGRNVSLYYRVRSGEEKRRHRRRRAWPKLTAVVDTHSHLILGAVTGTGPTQDSPDFKPGMRQAATLLPIETALADAGYDAEHNHRLCREELGVRQTVIKLNPRNVGRRWPHTACRREMRRRFPKALCHQRWHAESAFRRHERRLGSALTARRTLFQQRELVLRVLTDNLMLLIIWWCARISTEGLAHYASFDRKIEQLRVDGDLALVMGSETVQPIGNAPLAGQTVERRFTHVWRKEAGAWRLVARHANNVLSAR